MLTNQRAGNPRPEINFAGVPTELALHAGTAQMFGTDPLQEADDRSFEQAEEALAGVGAGIDASIPASEFRAIVVHADVAVHFAAEPLKDTQFVGGKNSAPIEPREPDRLDRCGARMG